MRPRRDDDRIIDAMRLLETRGLPEDREMERLLLGLAITDRDAMELAYGAITESCFADHWHRLDIREYIKAREGQPWRGEDTAYVTAKLHKIDRLAQEACTAAQIARGICPWRMTAHGEMAKCPLGFPGCSCADELMLNPHLQEEA